MTRESLAATSPRAWLERGGSPPALQQILEHASIAKTQRYAQLGDEVVKEQATRVWEAKRAAEGGAATSEK